MKCRWFKPATVPSRYRDDAPVRLGGLLIDRGFQIGEQHYDAMGAGFCEHERTPRGLVLNNYVCKDFEWPPVVDDVREIASDVQVATPRIRD